MGSEVIIIIFLYIQKSSQRDNVQQQSTFEVQEEFELEFQSEKKSAPVIQQQLLELEKEEVQQFKDEQARNEPKGRRLNILQAIIRRLLYAREKLVITERDFHRECKDASDNEKKVCLLIYNAIALYMPPKIKTLEFAYQIPFFLMTNQVMNVTGYSNFITQLCPLTKPCNLNSLRLGASALFSIFCSKGREENQVDIFNHYNVPTTSTAQTVEEKDAVFGSFFDLAKIHKIADSYHQNFGCNIIFLPGIKTVRLLGILKKISTSLCF